MGQWPSSVTYPEPLNTNAASDSGGDWWPQLATDGLGHWVAVWVPNDSFGGTIGTDSDIVCAQHRQRGCLDRPRSV